MKNSEPVNYTAASHVAVPLDTREIRCAPDRRKSRRFQRLLKCNEFFKQQCALSIRESYGKNTVCDACGYDQLSCLQKSEKINNKDPNRQSTKLGDIDIRSAVLPGKSTGSCVGLEHSDTESDSGLSVAGSCGSQRPSSPTWLKPGKCVAIDCEMVGTGPGGRIGELARCSVVNYAGNVIFDKYIQPELPITDYRTRWSGITRNHMKHAVPFKTAQKEILNLLKDKRVVGHALHNDFKALKYVHPNAQTRDTSKMPLLKKKAEIQAQHNVSLKTLAWCLLKKNIQGSRNGHCSIEDAQTSMELYKLVEDIWEQKLLHHCSQSKSSLESCVMDGNNYMEDRYWPPDLEEKN